MNVKSINNRRRAVLFLLLIFVLTMTFGVASVYGSTPTATNQTMTLDGKPLNSDVPVYVESDRALVPARAIFETAGGEITWDGELQQVTVVYQNKKVQLTINSSTALVDGATAQLDVPARLVVVDAKTGASRTMIPTRFVAESLGFGVGYDNDTRVISLLSPKKDSVEAAGVKVTAVDSVRESNYRNIKIIANSPISSYSDFVLDNPTRLVIDIKAAKMGNGLTENIPVSDRNSPVTAVRTGQFSEDVVRVVVDLQENTKPTAQLSNDKLTLMITVPDLNSASVDDPQKEEESVVAKKPSSLSDVLIVIDPGHGGGDPGSMGKENGTVVLNEKEPNLDVALRLNEKLQAAGLKTMMTRDSDRFCGSESKNAKEDLLERSAFANTNKATLFISIHNNSADNVPNAKGTETLYNETEAKAEYGISSKELATLVQKNMVSYCGTSNRGAKSRPELSVLRRTEMPAIIVEGAFLSNASDLKLLQTDTFRENYARAVADATIEYLNKIFK